MAGLLLSTMRHRGSRSSRTCLSPSLRPKSRPQQGLWRRIESNRPSRPWVRARRLGTETLRAVLVGMLREAWCAICLKKMRAHPEDAPIHPKALLEDPEILRRRTIEELNPPRLSDGELSYTDELTAVWRDRPELIQSIIDKIEERNRFGHQRPSSWMI